MSATDSTLTNDLTTRAREITRRELISYAQRTKGSQAATERARQVMPMGVPSSFQAYDPHPIVVTRAQGSWMEDVDGHRYTDYDMGFGALFAGHCHPLVRRAVEDQLENGTLFVTPCETNAEVAEMLGARYGLPMWRFTNSGTEATMDAIRVARGATGREKIVKVEGGYHGHHDEVMISMKPALDVAGPADNPTSVPGTAGITKAVLGDTIVIPYNDADALERVLRTGEVACFIVEPVMENIGICKPQAGYLQAVREITQRYGTLLIFDEVKTGITAGWSGATGSLGVLPDLVALAKSIGGGLPLGAFGGKREYMDRSPRAVSCTSARTTATRCAWPRRRPCWVRSARQRPPRAASTGTCSCCMPATASSMPPAWKRTPCSSAPKAASRGPRSRSATTATTRRPTSTSPSRNGSTASTAASCCRLVSTSSG